MSEIYQLGSHLREFLRGLLEISDPRPAIEPVRDKGTRSQLRGEWGPRVNISELRDNYAPQEIKPFTATPGGIDNLVLRSTDTFIIPGQGEFTVDFEGYFQVARDHPTTNEWKTCEVLVNILDMKLSGKHADLGEIGVSLNPDVLSTGQIFAGVNAANGKACRIATAAVFELPKLGISVFNKEPILLMNESIKSIPPVDDPNGHALLFRVPLFDRTNPQGKPVAYLSSLKYAAENYITEDEARSFRSHGGTTN
jgi:hypothetical protein